MSFRKFCNKIHNYKRRPLFEEVDTNERIQNYFINNHYTSENSMYKFADLSWITLIYNFGLYLKNVLFPECCYVENKLSSYDVVCKLFKTLTAMHFLLLYCYFHGKHSDEIHSLVSPRQTITARTHHTAYLVGNHQHSLSPVKLFMYR